MHRFGEGHIGGHTGEPPLGEICDDRRDEDVIRVDRRDRLTDDTTHDAMAGSVEHGGNRRSSMRRPEGHGDRYVDNVIDIGDRMSGDHPTETVAIDVDRDTGIGVTDADQELGEPIDVIVDPGMGRLGSVGGTRQIGAPQMTTSGGESAVVAEADDVVRVLAGPAKVESTTNTGADGGGIEPVDDDGNAAHRRRFEGGNRRLVGARRGVGHVDQPEDRATKHHGGGDLGRNRRQDLSVGDKSGNQG